MLGFDRFINRVTYSPENYAMLLAELVDAVSVVALSTNLKLSVPPRAILSHTMTEIFVIRNSRSLRIP